MATASSSPASSAAATNNSPSQTTMKDPELQNLFNQFDANGDGKISPDELSNVLSAFGGSQSSTKSVDLRSAMEEIDTDRDGFISLSEFSVLCHSTSANTTDLELRDAFSLYDQDKNGLISVTELHSVMGRLNMKCSLEECESMVKSVEADGDGNVNFEEFKIMMSGSGGHQ